MRPLTRLAAVATSVAVISVALMAAANAPPDQYVVFGPQATTIQDRFTHLVWQRTLAPPDGSVLTMDHASAAAACAQGGERLPTYRELLSLVDEDGHLEWDPVAGKSTYRYIDPNAFPGTPAGAFWSMSPGPSGGFKVVDFGTGQTRDETTTAYVRCVADAP